MNSTLLTSAYVELPIIHFRSQIGQSVTNDSSSILSLTVFKLPVIFIEYEFSFEIRLTQGVNIHSLNV